MAHKGKKGGMKYSNSHGKKNMKAIMPMEELPTSANQKVKKTRGSHKGKMGY